MFGDKGRFAQVVQDTFGDNGKVVKQVFDPNREGTPLYQLRLERERRIREVHQMLGTKVAVEEITKKTTRHGFHREDEVDRILSDIVKQRNADVHDHTDR